MMKNRIILTLTVVMALFASCEKDDNLKEIVLKESGALKATITNSEAKAYADKSVSLYEDDELIYEATTDANGVATFQHVNNGNYILKGADFEEGSLKYSFSRNVQVVTGEETTLNITPSAYSGKLTITLSERHVSGDNEYTDLVDQKGGNLLLIAQGTATGSDLASLKSVAVVDQKLADDSNKAVFEKLPYGVYGLVYYTDDNHYEALNRIYYSTEIMHYQSIDIFKETDISLNYVIDGSNFNEYKGSVSLEVYGYFQSGYSSKSNAKELKTGKIALISGYVNSNFSFEDVKKQIVAEKSLSGSSNKVEFNNVKIGTYRVLVYTNEDYYQIADLGFKSSSNDYFEIREGQTVENIALVNVANVQEIKKDQVFFCYYYSYESGYVEKAAKGTKIYILKSNDFNDLDYSFRRMEPVIKKYASTYGATNASGKLTLSVETYKEHVFVLFDANGNYIDYNGFYPADNGDEIKVSLGSL